MSSAVLILLARIIHIAGGIMWVGTMVMLSKIVLPIAANHGAEGASRWVGPMIRKLGPSSGIAAVLTILSGIYLIAVIHPHDTSAGGIVLMIGAAAALVAFFIGFFVGRPAGMKFAALSEQHAGSTAPSSEVAQQLSALQVRATKAAKLTVGLLMLAVLAMAAFRYAHVLA